MFRRPGRLMAVEPLWRPLPGKVVFADDMTDAPIRAGESAAADPKWC
jgi:hypothetical protein